jgi:hypothetical protein
MQSPTSPAPRQTPRPPVDPHEVRWRNVFFGLSAAMAAFGLVDIDAGRFAGAVGSFGIAGLMLSLMTEYPLVRLLAEEGKRHRPRADVLRDAQKLRAAHPWAERARGLGWAALVISLGLRLAGLG